MSDFQRKLAIGKVGESQIAAWLKGRGCHVLPIYEIEKNQGKGPALYCTDGSTVIAPDLLVFAGDKLVWIEAKHKNAFTWFRQKQIWETGIDLRHFKEYKKINMLVNFPVWLLFLHRGGTAKDSMQSPAGLYGGEITFLDNNISHQSDKYGPSGMVYWGIDTLTKFSGYPLSAYGEGVVLECDHVIPVARGGGHDDDNLVTACVSCNRSKSDKMLEDWKGAK